MGLFQTSVLKKYRKLQDTKAVDGAILKDGKAGAQILKTEIEKIDKGIDQMVYGLYELTDDEIKIVEDSV